MSLRAKALGCIASELNAMGIGWALIGGVALSAYGIERTSRDIDIAINMADEGATAAFADALRARGHTVVRAPHERLGEIVLVHPHSSEPGPLGVLIDLLPRACGFEAELIAAAREITIGGVPVPVACIGHLIAFKVKAMHDVHRARDRSHLRALLGLASEEEREVAREALRLSLRRGVLRADDPFALLNRYLDAAGCE